MILLSKVNREFQVGDERVRALQDVNLKILDGEYVAIMGPSGSGKSTLLNIMGNLDTDYTGILNSLTLPFCVQWFCLRRHVPSVYNDVEAQPH